MTQGLRKKLLPTLKSRRRLGARLAEGRRRRCGRFAAPWSRPGQVFTGLGAQRFVVGAASAQKERRQETGERHGR